jgi:hypothetical protein
MLLWVLLVRIVEFEVVIVDDMEFDEDVVS